MYRGLPPRLSDWFKAVIELDVGLREFRSRVEGKPVFSLKVVDRPPPMKASGVPAKPFVRSDGPGRRTVFRCFRCNQEGHQAAECPIPPLKTSGPQVPPVGEKPRDRSRPGSTAERMRLATHNIWAAGGDAGSGWR